jgi:hypothetical protein
VNESLKVKISSSPGGSTTLKATDFCQWLSSHGRSITFRETERTDKLFIMCS